MPENTAIFIKDMATPTAAQKLYRMSPPHHGHEHVVSSAVIVFGHPETYLFGSDADGTITHWGELDGSLKGTLDHEEAIREAGYVVVK